MKTRLLSGFVLGFVFLFFTLQSLPWVLFAILVIHVGAQLEFISLIPGLSRRVIIAHLIVSTLVTLGLSLGLASRVDAKLCLLLVMLMVVVYAVLAVLDYERGRDHRSFILLLRSILFVSLPFSFIPVLAISHALPPLLLLLFGASWAADTGAIFCGKAFGRTLLAPRISPKKTVEGALGGMLAAGLVFASAPYLYVHSPSGLSASLPALGPAWAFAAVMFLLGALLAVVGIFGDLTFSLFKREAGIKDYSLIIPGHGGLLDRFDSVLFAAPLIYFLSLLRF